jgi:hypothetical protein
LKIEKLIAAYADSKSEGVSLDVPTLIYLCDEKDREELKAAIKVIALLHVINDDLGVK